MSLRVNALAAAPSGAVFTLVPFSQSVLANAPAPAPALAPAPAPAQYVEPLFVPPIYRDTFDADVAYYLNEDYGGA